MQARRLGWISALPVICLSTAPVHADDRCRLTMTEAVPVKMEDLQPVITASINGVDARFIVDTGSFFDFLSPAAAAEFKLPLRSAPSPYYYITGIGGSEVPRVATARNFTVAGVSVHDAMFLVAGNDFHGGQVGLLGQNLFRLADVDFDFANGVLRFVKPEHCRGDEVAYWAHGQPLSVVDVKWTSPQRPHLMGQVAVNGRTVEAVFDTGATRTILSLHAARRAGINVDSPAGGAGFTSGGGRREVRVWPAPVDKFAIGGETIEHTHVLIGDIDLSDLGADMLLGADFFLAHHVYVAYSQEKVYFTYNGGRVFDLNAQRLTPTAGASKTPPDGASAGTPASGAGPQASSTSSALPPQPGGPGTGASPPGAITPASDMPTDAAGFLRRGMAHTSRHEYPQAIADLTRACALAPADATCRYQRGLAYWYDKQSQAALADFTAAILLQPNDFEAHLARGKLELRQHPTDARADFDAVDHLAPEEADLRLELAMLYDSAGEYADAVHQYDLWIEYHRDDVRLYYALARRCGSEGAADVDIERALDDCKQAMRALPWDAAPDASGTTINYRGMVYLRQGKLDSALADFDAALKLLPELASARYARGLVELRKGQSAQGQADLASAEAQQPDIAKHFASLGLKP